MYYLNGYNYIEITSENDSKAYVKVSYIKNTEIVITSLEERITALENALAAESEV